MNMRYIVILSAMTLIARNVNAQITFDTENIAKGEYYYAYNNHLYKKEETGKLDDEGNSIITGQYRYVLDNKEYIVTYTADKDGYHPKITISDYYVPMVAYAYAANLVASLVG